MSYIGNVDGFDTIKAALTRYKYIATSGQTTFTGADSNSSTLAYIATNAIVTRNGVVLDDSDFTANDGTSLVLGVGASVGDEICVLSFNAFDVANHFTQAQSNALYEPLDSAYTKAEGDARFKAISASEGGPSLGTNSIIRTNINTISENITVPANTNGMTAGPVTIADGYTVTLTGTWSIV